MTKRVLVTGAANIGKAGVATIVYKWGQHFDQNEIVYDYLMQSGLPDLKFQLAIKEKGGVIHTCTRNKNFFAIIQWVTDIIKEYQYKTLHVNSDSAYIAAAYIFAAKKAGIKDIYVHSHCTKIDDPNGFRRLLKTVFHRICEPYVWTNTKKYLACSKLAGEWMFGKKRVESNKYKTIYNGVEVDEYLYDEEKRSEIRKHLGCENKYVLANIGRLSYQKNQEFLINLFARYRMVNPNSMLMVVGDGELKEQLKNQVKKLKLEKDILFLGNRDDVPQLLSAFDVLVMPSRFEGLPVTMVEAQMASLPCVVSSRITQEAMFSPNVAFVPGWDVDKWIAEIERMRMAKREKLEESKRRSTFNIEIASKELQDILKGID